MKKILRLSLALLLTFSLIFSSLIFASAAPTVVTDEASFIAAVANGGVIDIANDITFTKQTTISTSVTINAGNHNITMYGNSGGEAITFTGSGTIVFNGGNWNNPTTADTLYFGSFTGTVKITGGAKFTSSTPINFNSSSAKGLLIIDDATIESTGVAIQPRGYTEIQILSGTITSKGTKQAIYVDSSYNVISIGKPDGTGPTIQNTSSATTPLIRFKSSAAAYAGHTIYGGTFINNGSKYVIDSDSQVNLSILGGTFTANAGRTCYFANSSVVNILGGEFSAAKLNVFSSGSATVNIKGGNFTKGVNETAFTGGTVNVSGGTFNFDPSSYVRAGYKATSSNDIYTVAEDASTLPAATTVTTYDQLTTAISNQAGYIKLGANITLTSAITINFNTVIEGNNSYKISGKTINVKGASTKITFKNVIYEHSGDALVVSETPDVTISGGQIFSTTTSDGNGAIYVNEFRGVLTVTDGAVIKAYAYPVYTSNWDGGLSTGNDASGSGIIYLGDCELVKANTSDSTKGIIWHQSNAHFVLDGCTINAAGGHRVFYLRRGHISIKNANITSSASNPIVCLENSDFNKFVTITGGTITSTNKVPINVDETKFYCDIYGGEFTATASYIMDISKADDFVTISGGNFTGSNSYDTIRMKGASTLTVNGGEFNTKGHSAVFQACNGNVNINGGTFSIANTDPAQNGAVIDTDSGSTCVVNVNNTVVDGVNSINHTGGIFLRHSTASQVTLNGLDIEQDSTIITIESAAGSITLNNCNLTSKPSAIVSESANPVYVKNYSVISSEDTLAIDGVWEKDATSEVNDQTNLHPFAKLIKEAAADSIVKIEEDYTNVPAVIINKNITLTSDGAHSVTFLGSGLKVQDDATLTIEGDITLNGGSEGNLLEADGILIVKGGTFNATNGSKAIYFDNASAVVRILGGTFNQAGSKYLVNMGNAAEFTVGNADGTGPSMTHTGSASIINTISSITAGTYTINGGTFVKQGSGYIMQVGNAITPAFTINGGEFTINNNAAMFALRQNNEFVVNGGTFTSKATSEELIYKVKGNVKIYGGAFTANSNSLALIGTSNTSSDAGSIVIDDAFDGDSDLSFTQNGSAPIIEYNDAGTVEIRNTDIARTGVDKYVVKIGTKATGKVTVSNSNLSADYAVISMPDTNSPVRLVLNGGTVVTSKFDVAIFNGVKDTNYTMTGTDKIVESDDPMDGSDRILKISGKKSDDYVGVDQYLKLESNTEYTYTFNYRATGGGVPYVTIELRSPSGFSYRYYWGSDEDTHDVDVEDTGTSIKVNFTTDGLDTTQNNIRIRLGNKAPAAATNGTVYYANVSLTKSGSSTNLIENGNFGWGLKQGWNILRVDQIHYFGFIKPVDGFFSDASVESNVADKAYVFEGGNDYHSFDFKVVLEAGASYKFSYLSRAAGDAPAFSVDKDAVTVKEEESDGYLKTYTLTNTGDEGRIRFRLVFEKGSNEAKAYITNLKLYKLKGQDTVGTNMIADLNPIFGLSDALKLNQDDEFTVSKTVGHGWLGNFRDDSDDNGSSKYAKIVDVSDDFFTYQVSREVVRDILLTQGAIEYNYDDEVSASDVYIDENINVVDLFIAKAESAGKFGADIQAEALKNEILTNTTTVKGTGKTYYVSDSKGNDTFAGTEAKPFKTIKKANEKAKSGDTILLKRGDTWRIEDDSRTGYSTVAGVTYSAYGDGAKPQILGSTQNWVGKWTHVSGNVYYAETYKGSEPSSKYQAGNIYLQKKNGEMVVGTIVKDQAYLTTDTASLTHEGDNYSVEGGSYWSQYVRVYAYFDKAPTAENYDSIEIAECRDGGVIELSDGVTINNIAVKYGGGHGIAGNNVKNVTVSYCEIGYVGGMLNFDVPMGNGIQFGVAGSNLTADHNYVYQCYDAGITPQSWVLKGDEETEFSGVIFDFTNVKITNNLLTNNFDNIEIWNSNGGVIEAEISGNILKDAAYCWSYNQRVYGGNLPMHGCHVYGGRNAYNDKLKLSFTNNIFDNTQSNIFCWFWGGKENAAELPDTFPVKTGDANQTHYMKLEGNSYYQRAGAYDGGQVMYYGNVTNPVHATSQAGLDKAVQMLDNSDSKYVRWVSTKK